MRLFCKTSLLLLISVYLSGCLDNSLQTNIGALEGKVYDYWGLPLPGLSVRVTSFINDVQTDQYGNFTFAYDVPPYDVYLGDYFSDHYTRYAALSITKPVLFDFRSTDGPQNRASIRGSAPRRADGRTTRILFISKDDFLLDNSSFYDTMFTIQIKVSNYTNHIIGKLIYLDMPYDQFSGNQIYFKYCIKDIDTNFEPFENIQIDFTASEIKDVPQNGVVNYNLNYTNAYWADCELNFPGYSSNNNIRIASYQHPSSGHFTIPLIPGLDCRAKISIRANFDNWKYCNAGGSVTLESVPPVTLMQPDNYDSSVTGTTRFEIGDDGEKGVYVIHFVYCHDYDACEYYDLITDKKTMAFDEIRNTSSSLFLTSHFITWYVTKYASFNSIDNFVSSKFTDSDSYSSTIQSDFRYFKIKR